MSKMLPVIGGWNDGKHIEPNGRTIIKMAKPESKSDESHKEFYIGFEYEIYELTNIIVTRKSIQFYMIEGMTIADAIEKLVCGYKQYMKRKV